MTEQTKPAELSDEAMARYERIREHGPHHYVWTDHDVYTLFDEVKRLRAAASEAFLAPLRAEGVRYLEAARWEAVMRDLVDGLLATHRRMGANGSPAVGLAFSEAATQLEESIEELHRPAPPGVER